MEITEILVTTSFTKVIRDYFVTVVIIFDIPLCNSKGALHLFFFSKSLPFVCDYPHRNQTIIILLNSYLTSNNMNMQSEIQMKRI